jgi:S-sulfo-L-cysteine synthase (O-acetyl-L-serine-dependent)
MLQTIDHAGFSTHTNLDSRHTLEGQVGNTPLLSLARIARTAGVSPRIHLFAKAEWFNPSGSVKDRPALNIIRTAERDGLLRPGITLLDSTSGNMGIAYAMLGRARGYSVRLVVPENVSPERIAVLRAYGVDLVLTDALEGVDGALKVARTLASENPDVFYANQYDNPANWRAHYESTANEIWKQTGGCITHFVTGMGTSGTFMGTTRRLRELNQAFQAIALQPEAAFNGIEGLKHMASAIRPAIYDDTVPDRVRIVRTEQAYDAARRLAREEGIFAGASAGANVAGALAVASELEEGVVVTVLPDSGFKYLSERFWQE